MDQRLQARVRLRQLPAQQRAAWLDIAEEEFRALGFEGASMNRILTRAALSKGQAYYYFADKGELYRAVIERAITELMLLDRTAIDLPGLNLPANASRIAIRCASRMKFI